jgi:hypothetical protein
LGLRSWEIVLEVQTMTGWRSLLKKWAMFVETAMKAAAKIATSVVERIVRTAAKTTVKAVGGGLERLWGLTGRRAVWKMEAKKVKVERTGLRAGTWMAQWTAED